MDITGEGSEVLDVCDVLLVVENSLVEVADGPTEGDVVVEELGELCSGLAGVGVTPGAEGHEDLLFLVEGHVAVHHG